MKTLIKSLMALALVLFVYQAQAQITFGVKAGANMNNLMQSYDVAEDEMPYKMSIGLHAGVTVDYALSENMSLQSGLTFIQKGANVDIEQMYKDIGVTGDFTVDGKINSCVRYLELPVNFAYKTGDLQIFAGPYVAMSLGGKVVSDYSVSVDGTEAMSEKDEFTLKPIFGEVAEGDLADDESSVNALDFGVNVGAGYNVGPVVISAAYSLGLGNLTVGYEGSDYDPATEKISNSVISLSVGYSF